MDGNQVPKEDLVEEFRTLGRNLADTLKAAWEAPERKRLQQEIEEGLVDLAATLKQEAATFRESPTGQRIKSDLKDIRQRVGSGEVEAAARSELLGVLRTINAELEKASRTLSRTEQENPSAASTQQEN